MSQILLDAVPWLRVGQCSTPIFEFITNVPFNGFTLAEMCRHVLGPTTPPPNNFDYALLLVTVVLTLSRALICIEFD